MFDYGARFYDPVIGRWNVIDRLAEYHFNTNPYHYVLNNPLTYIDPFGLDTVRPNQIVPPGPGITPFNPEVDVISLEGAVIKGTSKSNTSLILALVGATATGAQEMMHNKKTWYNLDQMKNYSQRYVGNQYQSVETITKAKKMSQRVSGRLKWLGRGLGLYGFFNVNKEYFNGDLQYNGRRMSDQGYVMEHVTNTFSTFGGTAGAGWGIGWEVGREIASDSDYRKYIRPVFQDFLGVERDEYPRYSEKLREIINNTE